MKEEMRRCITEVQLQLCQTDKPTSTQALKEEMRRCITEVQLQLCQTVIKNVVKRTQRNGTVNLIIYNLRIQKKIYFRQDNVVHFFINSCHERLFALIFMTMHFSSLSM